MLDLLITTLPSNYLNAPMAAPAFLKSAVEKNGFTCETLDFPMVCLHDLFSKNYQDYLKWIQIFPGEFDYSTCAQWQLDKVQQSLDLFVDLVRFKNPRFLGLSIFSYWQQRYAFLICQRLRQLDSSVKIIIGGMGCGVPADSLEHVTHLTYFDKKNTFANFMLSKNLVDYAIINDGEIELVKILQRQSAYQNTEVSNEVSFDHAFFPNYDDYRLDDYLFLNNEKFLMIQGSKGCVRQCVFCSEHGNYSKYYFKQGRDIANEMIALSQKYNIYKFHFSDSLVNGSLSVFRDWVKKIAEYNLQHPDKAIKWHGNYICRKHNDTSDEEYLLIKQSGAHGLTIGAESGSNKVLAEMKKQSTVEDLLYEIEKFDQFGIDCTLLMMVGFYTETWDDFYQTLVLLKKLQKYVFSRTVTGIRAGYTLMISDWTNYDKNDFIIETENRFGWLYKKNMGLTLSERIRRRIILQEFCDQLNIPVAYANEDLLILENMMNNQANFKELSNAHN